MNIICSNTKYYMSRLLFSTYEKGKNSIRYYAPISPQLSQLHTITGICCPCTCMYLSSIKEELRKSTYVQVNENRIEYNYPYSCISPSCSCVVYDHVHIVYFDRDVMENITTCDTCNSVILRKPYTCSPCTIETHSDHSSCCGMICLPCILDSWQLVKSIEDIRSTRLQDQHIQMTQYMIR